LSAAEKNRMANTTFAFPDERKEPLNDARHVRGAIARFDQVQGGSDGGRDAAWKRIVRAAKEYDVETPVRDRHDLGKGSKAEKGKKSST
jgi:hypothetical protein